MRYEISVVVIGKNESKNIPVLTKSLNALRNAKDIDSEFIYVDSASSDNSAEIASNYFDKVLVLEDSYYLCAAAGRNIGTINATKNWILYLDGDMELCNEFIENIYSMIESGNEKYGFLGLYKHVYFDGSIKVDGYGPSNNLKYKNETYVKHFGGAVLLPRSLVLKAGNYNPSVFSNEEIDLHTRIRGIGGRVKFVNIQMISHHTQKFSKLSTFVGFYWPSKFLGKKFFGFGQLLASRFKNKNILNLIRYFPYPFIFWSSIIITIILYSFGANYLSIAAIITMVIYITYQKGFKFLLLYPGLLPQVLVGWQKYNKNYKPNVHKEFYRDDRK